MMMICLESSSKRKYISNILFHPLSLRIRKPNPKAFQTFQLKYSHVLFLLLSAQTFLMPKVFLFCKNIFLTLEKLLHFAFFSVPFPSSFYDMMMLRTSLRLKILFIL